uniref:Glycos_transf_1 n=1 Tax=uncultured Alkalilimnicola sp. TaxID=543110 RepID=A0A060BW28_9GAMM|nr:Glycos_transf_1 [uncultured Alkalilimnicola sp.]
MPAYISISDTRKDFVRPITIGVVSRLEAIKGMDLVVPAFAKVHEKYSDSKLLVVGDGSQRALMEKQVKEADLNKVVEFAGRQPQDSLQEYYDRIDILLMPSRSEGFG